MESAREPLKARRASSSFFFIEARVFPIWWLAVIGKEFGSAKLVGLDQPWRSPLSGWKFGVRQDERRVNSIESVVSGWGACFLQSSLGAYQRSQCKQPITRWSPIILGDVGHFGVNFYLDIMARLFKLDHVRTRWDPVRLAWRVLGCNFQVRRGLHLQVLRNSPARGFLGWTVKGWRWSWAAR